MSKKKPLRKAPRVVTAPPAPVLAGDVFRAFVDEARSIGNEVAARRLYDEDVVAFLREKGLYDEWAAWRQAKRAPK
jgi:hypothetical protein